MITETQIIEAAKECGADQKTFGYHYETEGTVFYNPEQLTQFAQHFYRQGLLDAAEKCEERMPLYEAGGFIREYSAARKCAEAIRQMADEVVK
jgi:hypothetical protein